MKNWKQLKRHSLSAEYVDITGKAWDGFISNMKQVGFLKSHPIILHDEEVLDGWQRLRACTKLDIEPTFESLPDGITPEDYVKSVNDERRHETPDQMAARVEARRQRVAEGRASGKTFQQIADEEGVSQTQAKRDAKNSVSPPGLTDNQNSADSTNEPQAEPDEAPKPPKKVKGKDGKSYPASKKPKPQEPPDFDEEKVEHEEKQEDPCDGNGVPWASKAKPALTAIKASPKLKDLSRRLAGIMSEVSSDEDLRIYTFSMQSVVSAIKSIKETILDACPAYVCPYCDGSTKTLEGGRKGQMCEVCHKQGWVTASVYKRSPKGRK